MQEKNRSKTKSERSTLKWKICVPLSIIYTVLYAAGFNLVFPEVNPSPEAKMQQVQPQMIESKEAAVQEAAAPTVTEVTSTETLSPSEKNANLLSSEWVHGKEEAENAAAVLKENGVGEIVDIQTLQSERGATFGEQADYEDAVIYLLLIKDADGAEFIVRMDANGTIVSIQKQTQNEYAT